MAQIIDENSSVIDERQSSFTKALAQSQRKTVEESVLATGNWGKLRISKTGIYKISYEYLRNNGFLAGETPSSQLGVFGFGASYLGYSSAVERPEDLPELNIKIEDGGDGNFGPGDALFFYGQSPNPIYYQNNNLTHETNVYDRYSYYFITSDKGSGKPLLPGLDKIPNQVVASLSDHDYYNFYEQNIENVGRTGRRLYGEAFEFTTNRQFFLSGIAPKAGEDVTVRVVGASASKGGSSTLDIDVNGNQETQFLSEISPTSYDIARRFNKSFTLNGLSGGIGVTMNLNKGGNDVKAWLDFISINYKSEAAKPVGEPYFLNPGVIDSGYFRVDNFINPSTTYWDVTDPLNIAELNVLSGSIYPENKGSNVIVEFASTLANTPQWIGKQANQNLHAISNIDYIILYPKEFASAATRLADFHTSRGLGVKTVCEDLVYNEFSSGAKSVIGIRDFFKHVYDKDPSKLKYALLMGDGSYINLDGIENNSNLLPTYQSVNSERETSSYVTDDYFGMLGDNEGADENTLPAPGSIDIRSSDMDIAIGRFPVSNLTQANQIIDKIIRYTEGPPEETFGSWRNITAFVSDDLDGNFGPSEAFHIEQANELTNWINSRYPEFITNKYYMDAYPQETTPGGSRYPAINKLIKDRVQEGALLINYTGHGGEVGWAHERILDIGTINGWTNRYKMPLMVTATCEFSKFDDINRTSAGELCLLNPNGGAIALLTTTRVVFATGNARINLDFVEQFFSRSNSGEAVRIGDVYKDTKRQYVATSSAGINHLNFSLLGDPALEVAFPKNEVVTTKINGVDFGSASDTINALSLVNIEGEVRDAQGAIKSDFNGEVDVKVYDKEVTQSTLGNDNPDLKRQFRIRNSLIYRGVASVVNGSFSVQFVVPKDIRLDVGSGLIQYYAQSDETDANGGSKEIVVGGLNPNPIADNNGPDVDLYLNDLNFVSGDVTGENPNLLAFLFDETGINTTGTGIGHDILGIIDNDVRNAVNLNSFYRAAKDSYQEGSVEYPLEGISAGRHTLTLRVWDSNNNPSEASIDFIVRDGDDPFLEDLLVYPNPAINEANIKFTHNQGGFASEAVLEIFDATGRKVAQNVWNLEPQEKGTAEYRWDLRNSSGGAINPGTYVYRVTLNSESGAKAVESSTLLIVR